MDQTISCQWLTECMRCDHLVNINPFSNQQIENMFQIAFVFQTIAVQYKSEIRNSENTQNLEKQILNDLQQEVPKPPPADIANQIIDVEPKYIINKQQIRCTHRDDLQEDHQINSHKEKLLQQQKENRIIVIDDQNVMNQETYHLKQSEVRSLRQPDYDECRQLWDFNFGYEKEENQNDDLMLADLDQEFIDEYVKPRLGRGDSKYNISDEDQDDSGGDFDFFKNQLVEKKNNLSFESKGKINFDDELGEKFSKVEIKNEQMVPMPPLQYTNNSDSDCQIIQVKQSVQSNDLLSTTNLQDITKDQMEIIDLQSDVQFFSVKHTQGLSQGQIQRERFWDSKKENFVCATGVSKNYNENITKELDKLHRIYTNERDMGRIHAYRRAISAIKTLKKPIESVQDVDQLFGVGSQIQAQIKQILQTGKIERAQILENTDQNQITQLFSQIWGIGPRQGQALFNKGLKSLDDLRNNQHLLSRNQIIGLQYVEELQLRIPRLEAENIINIIQNAIRELQQYPGAYDGIPCGSYRRGKETIGDVDVLISRQDGLYNKDFMSNLINRLEGVLLTDHLILPKKSSNGSLTYMGIGKVDQGLHRRIDIKFYPREQYGLAVLYFTGSDYFNRSMRLFANRKGYSLSDHQLIRVSRGGALQTQIGQAISCYTEEEVFQALNLQYLSPSQRNI